MGIIDSIKHRLHPEIKKKFRDLYFNHRKGLDHFLYKDAKLSRRYSTIFFPDMKYGDMKIVVEAESTIISYDKQIVRTEKLRKWHSGFKDKTQKSRNAWKKGCNFGVYKYDISFPISQISGNSLRLSFTIWQHFYYACYLGKDIDFPDNLRYLLRNGETISPVYTNCEWDSMFTQLLAIKEQFPNLCVLWGHSNTEKDRDTIVSNCSYFRKKLSDNNISEYFHSDVANIPNDACIVIVNLFTSNKDIKTYIPNLFSIISDKTPFVTYLSMKKEYDKEEATAIYEEDRKRKIEEAVKIKKEIEKAEAEKKFRLELPSRLKNCVLSWDTAQNGLRFNYLVDYYPTNRYDDATEDMWDDRWTVWNFKNTPGKTSSERHDEALEDIVPRVTDILENTFGDLLNQLTLVCVPASSSANNTARYEEFSNMLCSYTGMDNSYDEISIVTDATPKHLGGTGKPEVSYNEDYFDGRFVILFDDVITSGRSLLRMKQKIESMGATVICAFTVGKTM